VIAFEMDGNQLDDFWQALDTLPPRLMLQLNSALGPLLYSALGSSLQKYFSGSSPARGPAGNVLTSRTGNLFNSVMSSLQTSVQDDAIAVSLGSELPYAAIHEYGGYAGRPGPFKKKNGHRPYLPARPYLHPAMDELMEALPDLVDQAFTQVASTL
jgi:phage gpG-like protein